MGGQCSVVDVPADDSTITDRDKAMVTETWQILYKYWEKKHGPAFFLRLFKNQPEVKNTFKAIASLTEDELLKSPILRAHVLVFGSTVTTWIKKLHDTDTLVALIHKLTDSHVIRGIDNPELFKTALQELLAYITEAEGLKPTQIAAWKKIAHLISSVIEERIKDLK